MLLEEIHDFFKDYTLTNVSFRDAVVSEEQAHALLDVRLSFTYKNRTIKLTFFINTSHIFHIHKNIPTTNKRVEQEMNKLVESFLSYLKSESSCRFIILLVDNEPIITGGTYSYYGEKLKSILSVSSMISLWLVGIVSFVVVPSIGFMYGIVPGILSLLLPIPLTVFILSSTISYFDKGMYARAKSKERMKYSLLFLVLITICIVTVATIT